MDILGAIAGGFDQNAIDEPKVMEREDGSLLVAGWMPVDEFADRIGIALADDPGYETVAGLVLHLAAELPVVGQEVTSPAGGSRSSTWTAGGSTSSSCERTPRRSEEPPSAAHCWQR